MNSPKNLLRIGVDYRVATAQPQTGIGRQIFALRDALRERPDTEVRLFSMAPTEHPVRHIAICPSYATPMPGAHRPQHRLRFEVGFLPRAIAAEKLDVYIATANSGLPWFHRSRKTKYALLLHDVFQLTLVNRHASLLKHLAYRLFDRFTISRAVAMADVIWTPSQYTVNEALTLFPNAAGKFRVLPNMVNAFTRIADDLGKLQLPPRYWLAVGTREPRKNIPLFLDAWRKARNANPVVPPLVLLGSREDLPVEHREETDLYVCNGLDDAQLARLYRQADYLWQPSYAEGFGLPVIEALSVGTPVAVATGSSLDEITPSEAPRFDPHDVAALTTLMQTLATTPPAGTEVARQAWATRYQAAAYAARLNVLIDELVPTCP